MKIGEFAEMNKVTTKMLRHYDEIGLFKPSIIDESTGYRSYDVEQSHCLNWIIILKNLDFSLSKIKELLNGPIDSKNLIYELISKRIELSSALNVQIQKRIQIDRLINLFEKEGFNMEKQIDLMKLDFGSVNEIKKNMPNMEAFLETAFDISSLSSRDDNIAVFRLDIDHFKQVNDEFGYEVGDKVIVIFYNIINKNVTKHLNRAALGRAYGDEFVVFARAEKEDIEKTAEAIINDLKKFDFESAGCYKQVVGSIGGLIARQKDVTDFRKMIDASHEIVITAKKSGPGSVAILEYTSE